MGYADHLFDLTDRVVLITGGSRGLGREMAFAAARCGADVVIASRNMDNCVSHRQGDRSRDRPFRHGLSSARGTLGRARRIGGGHLRAFRQGRHVDQQRGHVTVVRQADQRHREAVRRGSQPKPQGSLPVIGVGGRADGGRRPRLDHQRQFHRVAASERRHHPLRRGQGRAQRHDRGTGPGVRADRAGQHADGRAVFDRCQQGLGSRRTATHNTFSHLSLQRAGDPPEIVGAALFLASDASSFTTGSILRADGGIP